MSNYNNNNSIKARAACSPGNKLLCVFCSFLFFFVCFCFLMIATNQTVFQLATGRKTVATTTATTTLLICFLSLSLSLPTARSCTPDKPNQIKLCSLHFRSFVRSFVRSPARPPLLCLSLTYTHLHTRTHTHTHVLTAAYWSLICRVQLPQ